MTQLLKTWLQRHEQRKFGMAPPDYATIIIRTGWIVAAVITVAGAFLYAGADTGRTG